MGIEAPRDDVLELADEVQELRHVVQRLACPIVWDTASLAATGAEEPVVQAQPLEIAKDSTLTESVFAETSGEAGSPKSRAGGKTGTAEVVAVAESVAEAGEPGSSWPGERDVRHFQSRSSMLNHTGGKFPDFMEFKAGTSTSRLRFVQAQQILRSLCTGSKKLRLPSQLTNL